MYLENFVYEVLQYRHCFFRSLLREVQKRTILSVLRLVEHMYINIEAKELAKMLGAESNIELQQVVDTGDVHVDLSY